MSPKKCCVQTCSSTCKTHRLYSLPKNDKLRALWLSFLVPVNSELLLLNKDQLLNRRVCQKHFDKYQFDYQGNRLRDSYPTLFTSKEIEFGVSLPDEKCIEHNYCKIQEFEEITKNTNAYDDHSYLKSATDPTASSSNNSDIVTPTSPHSEDLNDSMEWVDLTEECPDTQNKPNATVVPTLDLEVIDEKLNGSIRKHDVIMEEEDVSFYEDDADKENTDKDNLVHAGFECNVCQNQIIGFRYVCVECVDWDMCSECEARAEHSQHYVLRIPAPRPQAEIQKVLQCIRHELSELHDNIQYCDNLKEEVLCDTMQEEVLCDTVKEEDLSDSDPLQLFNNDNQTLPYETKIPELEEIPTQHTFHKTKSKPITNVNSPSQLDHDKDKEEISYSKTRGILKLKVPLDVNLEILQKSLNKQLMVNLTRLSPSNICVDGILCKSADLYEDLEELT